MWGPHPSPPNTTVPEDLHSRTMTRLYELMCLAKPALPRAEMAFMMQQAGDLIMDRGGVVTDVVSFGEQLLGYDVRKPFVKFDRVRSRSARRTGCAPWGRRNPAPRPWQCPSLQAHMWQMRFAAPSGAIQELDRQLKLNENVLRHVVTNRRHEREASKQATALGKMAGKTGEAGGDAASV